MTHMLIVHKVADFARWKVAYDAHAPVRQKAGLKEKYLLRNVADPSEVVILFEAEDLKRAQEFGASANLRETMHKAGVVGVPSVSFLS